MVTNNKKENMVTVVVRMFPWTVSISYIKITNKRLEIEVFSGSTKKPNVSSNPSMNFKKHPWLNNLTKH